MKITVELPHLISELPDQVIYEFTCSHCKQKIKVNIKKDIVNTPNLRFPFEYVDIHGDPPHGITLYIDRNWAVRGMELFKHINLSGITGGLTTKNRMVPKIRGKVSPMAQQLGIVSKKEYQILQKIDGQSSIDEIASMLNQSVDDVNGILQKLVDKNLVRIETKS